MSSAAIYDFNNEGVHSGTVHKDILQSMGRGNEGRGNALFQDNRGHVSV